MHDIGLSWPDFIIILSGFAACGTLAGLTIRLVDRAVAAKRRKTMLPDDAPETSSAAFAHKDKSRKTAIASFETMSQQEALERDHLAKTVLLSLRFAIMDLDLSGNFSAKYDASTRKVLIEGKVQQGGNEYSLDNVVDPFLGPYPRSQAIVNEEVLQIFTKVLNETLPPDQRAKYAG